MNNFTINGKVCQAAYDQYLELITVLNRTVQAMDKGNAYTDYLRVVQELVKHYNPDLTLAEQVESIQKIIKRLS